MKWPLNSMNLLLNKDPYSKYMGACYFTGEVVIKDDLMAMNYFRRGAGLGQDQRPCWILVV